MGGKTYKTGVETRYREFIYFNLDSQYKEVQGEIGTKDITTRTVNDVNIYLDGKLYKSIEIAPDKAPEKVTIPVSEVNELKFKQTVKEGSIGTLDFGLGDFTIK